MYVGGVPNVSIALSSASFAVSAVMVTVRFGYPAIHCVMGVVYRMRRRLSTGGLEKTTSVSSFLYTVV